MQSGRVGGGYASEAYPSLLAFWFSGFRRGVSEAGKAGIKAMDQIFAFCFVGQCFDEGATIPLFFFFSTLRLLTQNRTRCEASGVTPPVRIKQKNFFLAFRLSESAKEADSDLQIISYPLFINWLPWADLRTQS